MNLFYIFLILGISLVGMEIFTPSTFIFFSVGIGFILSSFLSFFTDNLGILLGTTAFISLIVLIFMRKTKFFSNTENYVSNIEKYIDKEVKVVEILEDNRYRVSIYSEVWLASSEDVLKEHDLAIIKGRNGSTFIINKK